jgi:RNA polymerase sigma-70 factor (ECF subfamily)
VSKRSFADVAEEHLDDVYRYLLYMTGNPHLAEDLAAETFERALRRWRRFDHRRGAARTWLCQLARGPPSTTSAPIAAAASARACTRQTFRSSTSPSSEKGSPPRSTAPSAACRAAEREVVVLRVVLELDGETTREVLGIRPTAVSTRLSRALQKLEERMVSDVRG